MVSKFFSALRSIFSHEKNAVSVSEIKKEALVVPDEIADVLPRIVCNADSFAYLLRMFWQVRFGKMSSDYLPALDWLTRTFLPADVIEKGYHYPSYDGPACFKDLDHYALASEIVTNARARLHVASPA